MPTFTASVDGVSQLAGSLKVWERRKHAAVAGLVTKYAGLIAAAAQADAPRASGRLAESIKPDLERVLRDLIGEVKAGVFYARFVELGTDKLAANPFLFPAFERYARAYYTELQALLNAP